MKIYIAGPLFNESELRLNREINDILVKLGHETYLPQEDGGCFATLPDIIDGMTKDKYLFERDVEHLKWCDTILFIYDGRVPDEGACFELGYGYAAGKRCIGYRTDSRGFIGGEPNLMLRTSIEHTVKSLNELELYFS